MLPPPDDRRRRQPADALAGSLSPNQRRLLERMRRLGYGTIRGLHVRAGDPLFDPPPLIVRAIRLSEVGSSHHESVGAEKALKREQIAFVRELAAVGTGVIDVVKVHDGLPVGLEIHEQP